MPIVSVQELDADIIEYIRGKFSLSTGSCFSTSFKLVALYGIAEFYVLGFATNSADNIRVPHAWVQLKDGRYADPLLQHHGLIDSTTYDAIHHLSKADMMSALKAFHGDKFARIERAEIDFYPPEIDDNGRLVIR